MITTKKFFAIESDSSFNRSVAVTDDGRVLFSDIANDFDDVLTADEAQELSELLRDASTEAKQVK